MDWRIEYQRWKEYGQLDDQLRANLEELTPTQAEDAFSSYLSFGTAGMRGIMGAGLNRMNVYTVRQATEGLARLIEDQGKEAMERGVVIAYDSRHQSSEFAMQAALVLGYHGIKVYLFESLRPTPVLSFSVRHLKAYAGIMITASHNPSEYNGYKVYGEDGGQMPPALADRLSQSVAAVQDILTIPFGDKTTLLGSGQIEIISDRLDQAYLDQMRTVTLQKDLINQAGDQVKIVYTPLHGAGLYLGLKALHQAGFSQVHVVEDQAQADGDFPTVKYPNPESPAAFDMAEQLAQVIDADVILATDPDADRLGAMIRNETGTFQLLTGNQIAVLMLDYLLTIKSQSGDLPSDGVVIKSIVSTDLVECLTRQYQVELVEVLTGFKYIGEKIKQYEQNQSHSFLMGFEESYGYLLKTFARDKDAIQALVFISELTAYHKQQGNSLSEVLEQIYQRYGYYYEETLSFDYPGLGGRDQMKKMMTQLREMALKELADFKVIETIDCLSGIRYCEDGHQIPLVYPKSDVLKYRLTPNAWFALRPSGTEPKIKLYLGVVDKNKEEAMMKAEQLKEAARTLLQV